MVDGFTIALLAAEFGQVWAEHVRRDVRPQLRSTLDSIVGLGNRITYDFVAPGDTKSHRTLGEIVRLYNCAVADITPQLRLSAKTKDDHL